MRRDRQSRETTTRHILPRWLEHPTLERQQAHTLCTAILDTGRSAHSQILDMETDYRTADRMIPIMCHGGLGGAIPGTRPGDRLA